MTRVLMSLPTKLGHPASHARPTSLGLPLGMGTAQMELRELDKLTGDHLNRYERARALAFVEWTDEQEGEDAPMVFLAGINSDLGMPKGVADLLDTGAHNAMCVPAAGYMHLTSPIAVLLAVQIQHRREAHERRDQWVILSRIGWKQGQVEIAPQVHSLYTGKNAIRHTLCVPSQWFCKSVQFPETYRDRFSVSTNSEGMPVVYHYGSTPLWSTLRRIHDISPLANYCYRGMPHFKCSFDQPPGLMYHYDMAASTTNNQLLWDNLRSVLTNPDEADRFLEKNSWAMDAVRPPWTSTCPSSIPSIWTVRTAEKVMSCMRDPEEFEALVKWQALWLAVWTTITLASGTDWNQLFVSHWLSAMIQFTARPTQVPLHPAEMRFLLGLDSSKAAHNNKAWLACVIAHALLPCGAEAKRDIWAQFISYFQYKDGLIVANPIPTTCWDPPPYWMRAVAKSWKDPKSNPAGCILSPAMLQFIGHVITSACPSFDVASSFAAPCPVRVWNTMCIPRLFVQGHITMEQAPVYTSIQGYTRANDLLVEECRRATIVRNKKHRT